MNVSLCYIVGRSGNCFPAEICEGESTQSCEARFSPSRSPFLGTHFEAYVVECATLLVGRCTPGCRSRQAEPMDEGGRESGPRSGPVPWDMAKKIEGVLFSGIG